MARREPQEIQAMPISSMADIEKIGHFFTRSGMFGCKSPEQGNILALTCYMEKMTPLQFKRKYHMIDGTVTMRSDAMLAEARTNYGARHKWIKRDSNGAEIEVTGADGAVGSFALSWEEAQEEPFVYAGGSSPSTPKAKRKFKTNYATPRARMQTLAARVASDAVRAMVPEVNAGTYSPEDVADFGGANAEPRVVEASPIEAQVIDDKKDAEKPIVILPSDEEFKKEAARQAAEAKEAKTVPPEVTDDETDYSAMPIGKQKGKKWDEFDIETLKIIVAQGMDNGISELHVAAANAVLGEMIGVE